MFLFQFVIESFSLVLNYQTFGNDFFLQFLKPLGDLSIKCSTTINVSVNLNLPPHTLITSGSLVATMGSVKSGVKFGKLNVSQVSISELALT